MKNKLVSGSLKIFGGSAVAGMGFAFGRDIYKNLKKWFLILVILAAFFSLYTTGVWIARNYNHILKSIFVRLGALIVGIPSSVVLYFCGTLICFPILTELHGAEYELTDTDLIYPVILPALVLLVGLVVGSIQRKKRRQIWDAELFNLNFMDSEGLIEHEDGTIEDTENSVNYKIDFMGKERVTLMPIGKRNKRAYIYIDEVGKYSSFTGLASI